MFLSVMKRTVLFFTVSQSNAEVCEVDDSEFWSDDGDSKKENNMWTRDVVLNMVSVMFHRPYLSYLRRKTTTY